MSSYEDSALYKLAKQMAVEIHKMTLDELPKFEMYEQGSQIRRSIDIQKNILNWVGVYPCGRPWWGRRKAVPLPKTLSEHL